MALLLIYKWRRPHRWPAPARRGGAGGSEGAPGARMQQASATAEMRGAGLQGVSAVWGGGWGVLPKASYSERSLNKILMFIPIIIHL